MNEHLVMTDSGLRSVMSAELMSHKPEGKQVRVLEVGGNDVRFYAARGLDGIAYRVHENGCLEIALVGTADPVRVYSGAGWLSVEGAVHDSTG